MADVYWVRWILPTPHDEIWIGAAKTGFAVYGYAPTTRWDELRSLFGLAVPGRVWREPVGGDPPGRFVEVLRHLPQSEVEDKASIMVANTLSRESRWQSYHIRRNNCRAYTRALYPLLEGETLRRRDLLAGQQNQPPAVSTPGGTSPLAPPARSAPQAAHAAAPPCRSVPAGATLPLPCDLPTVSAPTPAAAAFTPQPAANAARPAAITHALIPPQTVPVAEFCAHCAADLLRLAERVCSGERLGPADLQAFGWFGTDLQLPPLDPAAAPRCPKEMFAVLIGRHQARQRLDPDWLNSEAGSRRPAPMAEPIPERPTRERRGCTMHGVWHEDCYPE